MNTQKTNEKPRLPIACIVIFALTAISAILYLVFRLNADFADAFNSSIGTVGRMVMAKLTAWIPFSFAEMLLLLSPVILITVIVIGAKYHCETMRQMWIYVAYIFCIACMVFNVFVWNFAPGYNAHTLDQKLGLERKPVSGEELYTTANILLEELKVLEKDILFMETGASRMPYSYTEMNTLLMKAYDKACEKYDFIDDFHSKVKPVMLSEPMSYTHITGIYTFFTGEANINVNFPDYTIPFTAAHELAHQRGIAREDEANFVAFLVCMESDDAYIRYSGALNLYEYVISSLYSANKQLYKDNYAKLPKTIVNERIAYSEFFEKYRENTVANISEATNNAYLQSQGAVQGTRSYGMVVDLAVAYYQSTLSSTSN
ncbi:MAG: DUF3810 domain-containing protein [Clostridia bacterium]|nr:DUF3810 domain-containing protein [Clostridia bacterium]